MVRILIVLLLVSTFVTAQPKGEVREFTGVVKAFKPGFGLAYERLIVDVSGTEEQFVFYPVYGELMVNNFKVGDQITFRANVNPVLNERIKKMSEAVQKSFRRDFILAIKFDGRWVEMPEDKSATSEGNIFGIFLDLEVKDEYMESGHQIGLIFDNGLAAYNWFQQKNKINIGDRISFRGYRFPYHKGFVFPMASVKNVYFFAPLKKVEGTIKSLLFKQNYVCIGMNVKTKNGDIRMGFPSNYGKRIQELASQNKMLTFYFDDHVTKNQLNPPDLQAIVDGTDTIKIEAFQFYGGADVKHEHKAASVKGKITAINKSANGQTLSLILGDDCYVEVDRTMEKQLGHFFKKGRLIEVSGDERLKIEGEIYSRDYRIITPRSLTIDGKSFLLGQHP